MCWGSWWTINSSWASSVLQLPAEGHQYPRLYKQKGSQQAERSNSSLCLALVRKSGVLCPVLGSLVKEGHWQTGVNLLEGHCGGMFSVWNTCPVRRGWRTKTSSPWRKARSLKLTQDLIAVFRYLTGEVREDRARLFEGRHSKRMRGNRHKMELGEFWLDIWKNVFTMSMVKHWSRDPQEHSNLHPWLGWSQCWTTWPNWPCFE